MKTRRFHGSAAQLLLAAALAAAFPGCGSHSITASPVVAPPTTATIAANTLRVHYHRNDGAYTGWGVYAWAGPATPQTSGWPDPNYVFSTADGDSWGMHVDIPMAASATTMSFLVINPAGGGTKDTPGDMTATFPSLASQGAEIWILSGDPTVYGTKPAFHYLSLNTAKAVWLAPDTLVWPGHAGSTFKLFTAAQGGIASDATTVSGADASFDLAPAASISAALQSAFPQYAAEPALAVPSAVNPATALKGQVAVVAYDASGKILDGTSVQFAPVLDAVYGAAAASKALGVTFQGGVPTFSLWAPTAQSVTLNTYAGPNSASGTAHTMAFDAASGVWSCTISDGSLPATAYYDYAVKVFSRAAGNAVVTNTVTDPYSVSLDANSQHSMVLDLAAPSTAPQGWPGTLIPTAPAPTDAVVYELHVRDFSAYDPGPHAGQYLAFTDASAGTAHLAALAAAGLTHVHLLPVFDISSIDEVHAVNPAVPASTGAGLEAETYLTTNSGAGAPQDLDRFNWGYDPWHFGAPEGSYASDAANGLARVMEFRQMVMALHGMGLRVVMDVVYNHTTASGQDAHAVLDRIVPGYYHRLDANGAVENSSCCADTAPEFAMMEKLMTDTLVRWADQYKVDAFRFDIMGFIPKAALVRAQAAVNAVAQADGRGNTYFYGEGWNFGAVQNNALFTQASQLNLGGTGIGSFNDRIRDAVRGGGPFDTGASVVANQGFASGLFWDPFDGSAGTAAQRAAALAAQNRIELGLAGNLAAFPLTGTLLGSQVDYNGQPTAYAGSPQENVAYVSCHDNETLWDISQYKHAPSVAPADRARAQVVALSTVLLSDGVAFIHAGDDLLRSKSDDSNSYNSGDYFNRIFWDGSSNNWAVGAPPQNTGNNAANLAQEQAALTQSNAAVGSAQILAAAAAFQDFLRIRKDSNMFRLPSAADVLANVRFPDQALGQVPGVILMQVGDGTSPCGDGKYASAFVVFNGTKTAQTITYPWYKGRSVALHAAQAGGNDTVVQGAAFSAISGQFQVPARTTAVFVESKTNGFTGTYPTMYVRGSMNGWDTSLPMRLVAPNTWQATLALAAQTCSFKFDTGTWASGQNWGDDGLGDGVAASPGSNFTLDAAAAGNYVFQFNDSTLAWAVLPPVWYPGAPTLTASSASATSIALSWNASGGALAYRILRSTDGTTFAPLATTSGTSYTDTGLTTGATYTYAVVAANNLFASAASAPASATPSGGTAPASPYAAMYMNGSWNSWATKTGAGKMALTADDTWSVRLANLAAGDIQFKFDTDDNWGKDTGATAWTASDASSKAMTGTCAVSAAGSANITITLPSAGNYTFTFNDKTLAYACTKN